MTAHTRRASHQLALLIIHHLEEVFHALQRDRYWAAPLPSLPGPIGPTLSRTLWTSTPPVPPTARRSPTSDPTPIEYASWKTADANHLTSLQELLKEVDHRGPEFVEGNRTLPVQRFM